MSITYILIVFFIYSFLGWSCEVAFSAVNLKRFVNRGFLNGPLCPIYGFGILSVVLLLQHYRHNTVLLYILSVIVATLLELITGILLEKLFHHKWWDYSDRKFNIKGYICPQFSIAWGVACVVVIKYIHPVVVKTVRLIPINISILISLVLVITLLIDLYITIHEILKLNMKLEKMQLLADEIERLSVHIGENLSLGIINSIEKTGNAKQKLEEMYNVHMENMSYTSKRLLKAFPSINSVRYRMQLQSIKEHLKNKGKGK